MNSPKKNITWISCGIAALISLIATLFYVNFPKNTNFEKPRTPDEESLPLKGLSADSQYFYEVLNFINTREMLLREEYRKCKGIRTEEWKRSSARLNLDLKAKFIHLDEAVKQDYPDAIPSETVEVIKALEKYKSDLLFVWRELDSELFKHSNQLPVAERILVESKKIAEDKIKGIHAHKDQ